MKIFLLFKALTANSYAPVFLIFRGWVITICISLMLLLLLTGIIYWVNITEKVANYSIPIISLLSIFTGSYLTGRKTAEKGWLKGGLTGLLYVATLLILAFSIGEAAWQTSVLLKLFIGFIIGAIGGIIGINS